MLPFTVNFKLTTTGLVRPFPINLNWTMTDFIYNMREQVFYEYNLDNVEFIDDLNRFHHDTPIEQASAIQPSNISVRQRYADKINIIAFYIRPRVTSDTDNLSQQIDIESQTTEPTNAIQYPSCVICLTRERNMVFSPCHHLCACSDCGSNPSLQSCPLCRVSIGERQIIYV